MSGVNSTSSGEWDVVSGAKYAFGCLIDNPVTKKTMECVCAPFTYLKETGKDCLFSISYPWAIGRGLTIIKALGPSLEGKQELFLNSIEVYDQLGLASEALRLFHSHKKQNPHLEFAKLRDLVNSDLGQVKASKLFAAARAVYGPSATDDQLLQSFFNGNVNQILSDNSRKQDKILDDTFMPLVAQLPCWVLVPSRWASKKMLNLYRDAMKGPAREASLVDQLSVLLYKGISPKNEATLPNTHASNLIKGSLEWQAMLREESGVSNVSEFIANAFSVISDDISHSIRRNIKLFDYVSPDNEEAAAIFDFISTNIKVGFLKLINSAAGNNIDDISINSAGKGSKALPANTIISLSRLWDIHKDRISAQVATLRASWKPEIWKVSEYQAIFKELADDLVKSGGINPFDELDILSADQKKSYWEEFQNKTLPHILEDFYRSLTQWEVDRVANENKLTSRTAHGVSAIKVGSRFIVESIQNYLVMNPIQIGDNLKNAFIRKFESAKTTPGNKAANFLKDKVNDAPYQSVLAENLPMLAKEEPLWNTVENVVQPTVMKLASDLVCKIGKIEDNEGSAFFRDTSLKILELFAGHMRNINSVQFEAGMNSAEQVNKCQMAAGVLNLQLEANNSSAKGHKSAIDKEYILAKDKLFKAREKLEESKSVFLQAANAYNSAKQWFNFGEGFFSRKADEAIKNVEDAEKEVVIAEAAFSLQLKLKRGKPMALKILSLFNIYSAADLPLSKEQSGLRDLVWEMLTEEMLPTMFENLIQNVTSKSTMNKILKSVLEKVQDPIKALEQRDLAEEGVLARLEQIAHNSAEYEESSNIASQILAKAKGGSLSKAIREVMVQNKHAVLSMKNHFKIGCGALPHVRAKWDEMLNAENLEVESNFRKYHSSHGREFDKACGSVIKEVVDMLLHRWASSVNIMKIHTLNESASETVGKLAREKLEQFSMLNVLDMAMESAVPSLLPSGQWDERQGTAQGKGKEFVKSETLQEEGFTRDFHLPLSAEAKREWKIQNVLKENETSTKVHEVMTSIFSHHFKGIFTSIVSTGWQKIVEWLYSTIDYLFAAKAPRVRDALRTVISFCLDKLFANGVQAVLDSIKLFFDKPFTFLLEKLYVSSKADKTIKWLQMDHVHDEFLWDALEILVDETAQKAAKVGA